VNRPDLLRINDTRFASERSSRLAIYAVGFADRSRPGYCRFVRVLEALAHSFGPRGVPVRLIHTDEHPGLVRTMVLGNYPTLMVYSFGERFARWAGRIELPTPRLLLEALLAAYKDDPGI
jgi:hypothetical protein